MAASTCTVGSAPPSAGAPSDAEATIVIPRLSAMLRHAAPHLVEGTLIPLALFYTTLWLASLWWALAAAVGWAYFVLVRRIVRRRRVGGLLVLAVVTLTIRVALAVAAGSAVIYFLQSPIAKAALGFAFLGSVVLHRPVLQRLAGDFIDIPEELAAHPAVRSCFARLTLLWSVVLVVHAWIVLWMLVHWAITTYLATKTAADATVKGVAIAASLAIFRRALARDGIAVVRT